MDISIIIPLYKGKKYVESLLESVKKNMVKYTDRYAGDCELIFVNDNPSEHIEVSHANGIAHLHVHILNTEKNQGIHGARVSGYYKSCGKYILFLDQDDKISDDYLVQQRLRIQSYDAIVCNAYLEKSWTNIKRKDYQCQEIQNKIAPSEYLIRANLIYSPGQVLMRRDKIPSVWLKNIMSVNGTDDYMLWILMMKEGVRFTTNPSYLYTHVEHGNNVSGNPAQMNASRQQMSNILKRNGCLNSEELKILEEQIKTGIPVNKKYTDIITAYDQWLCLKQRGLDVSDYFIRNHYKKIAIYGMNQLGNRLYEELRGTPIDAVFAIDQNAARIECDIPICTIDSEEFYQLAEQVDAIVVTAISAYEEIQPQLQKKYGGVIISLKEILVKMVNEW